MYNSSVERSFGEQALPINKTKIKATAKQISYSKERSPYSNIKIISVTKQMFPEYHKGITDPSYNLLQ